MNQDFNKNNNSHKTEKQNRKSKPRYSNFLLLNTDMSTRRDQFEWVESEQSHLARRRLMLKKYPILQTLMKPDSHEIYVGLALVFSQVIMCHLVQDCNWLCISIFAYFISGTLNHCLLNAIHNIGHNIPFGNGKYVAFNRYLGFIANLPIGIPMSISFKRYHIG